MHEKTEAKKLYEQAQACIQKGKVNDDLLQCRVLLGLGWLLERDKWQEAERDFQRSCEVALKSRSPNTTAKTNKTYESLMAKAQSVANRGGNAEKLFLDSHCVCQTFWQRRFDQ